MLSIELERGCMFQMKSYRKPVSFLILLFSVWLMGDEVHHSLSLQGYTGIINTPNAQVMAQGDIGISFNNQYDNFLRNYDYDQEHGFEESYFFGVGLLPYVELQGRLTSWTGYRDLSANVKIQFPFHHPYLPDIAVGYQDVGSAVNNYGNKYIVIDKSFGFIRPSLGYGVSDNDSGKRDISPRMDGVFGGVEVQTFDWLYLLGEYDGEETHAGVRIESPRAWSDLISFNTVVASNLSDDNEISMAFNLVFSLYEKERYTPPQEEKRDAAAVPETSENREQPYAEVTAETPVSEPVSDVTKEAFVQTNAPLTALASNLAAAGLENVTVKTQGKTLYIAYENSVYRWNELDALGVVMGEASRYADRYERFVIEPLKSRVRVAAFHGSLPAAAAYYDSPSYATKMAFAASLSQSSPIDTDDFAVVCDRANGSLFKGRLELSPLVMTFVGTEVGVFDYELLLRTKGYTTLYDGFDLSVVYDLPVDNSAELDPDYGIFRNSYIDGGFDSVMLNYTANVFGVLSIFSAGTYGYDYAGAMEQLIFNKGRHTFKLEGGYFENTEDDTEKAREYYVATYSYHYVPMDLFGQLRGGKYWNHDNGFEVQLKRFFGDVAIGVGYLQSHPEEKFFQSEDVNHYVSLGIELPIAFRKSPLDSRYAQLEGTSSWSYGLRSTVARKNGMNNIVTSGGRVPQGPFVSQNYLFNRNRLNAEYIQTHAERLLDAYKRYGENLNK